MEKITNTNYSKTYNISLKNVQFSIGEKDIALNEIIEIYNTVIANIVQQNKNIILIYPFLYCSYLSIFAIKSYYTLLSKYDGSYPKNIPRTLILTSRESLHIKLFNTIQKDRINCQTFIMPGRLNEDGSIQYIAEFKTPKSNIFYSNSEDCLILFSKYAKLNLPDRVKCVIVDVDSISMPYFKNNIIQNIESFKNNVDSIIFVTSSLDIQTINYLKNRFNCLIFGIHPALIETICDVNSSSDWILQNMNSINLTYSSFCKTFYEKIWTQPLTDEDEVSKQLIKCWKDFNNLIKLSSIQKTTLENIIELLNRLQNLVIPPKILEKEEKNMFWYAPRKNYTHLHLLLRNLENECSNNDALKTVFLDIKQLYDLLNYGYGKPTLFKQILNKFIEARKDIAIFCTSEPEYRALKKYLISLYNITPNTSLESYGIFIKNYKDMNNLDRKYDYVIITNFFINNASLSEIILFPLFIKCIILAYPHELYSIHSKLKKLDSSLNEILIEEPQITLNNLLKSNDDDTIINFFNVKYYNKNIYKIKLKNKQECKLQLFSELESKDQILKKIDRWTSIVNEVKNVVENVLNRPIVQTSDEITDEESTTTENNYVRVTFENGSIGKYYLGQIVDILLDDKVDEKSSETIVKGDRILLIDDSYKKNLLQLILEMLSSTEYDKEIRMTEIWWKNLQHHSIENNHTPEDILELLKAHNSDITSIATIKGWLKGNVYGPNNQNNIKLIGEIYNDVLLKEYWKEIGNAISKVRGIRIKTGKMIAKHIGLLLKGAFIDDVEISNEFEKSLGLKSLDILNHIKILTVVDVKIISNNDRT